MWGGTNNSLSLTLFLCICICLHSSSFFFCSSFLLLPPPQCARTGARCDYSLFLGASATNHTHLHRLASQAFALKMYLNTTFSTLRLDSMESWMKVIMLNQFRDHMWAIDLQILRLCSIYLTFLCLPAFRELAQGSTDLCPCWGEDNSGHHPPCWALPATSPHLPCCQERRGYVLCWELAVFPVKQLFYMVLITDSHC